MALSKNFLWFINNYYTVGRRSGALYKQLSTEPLNSGLHYLSLLRVGAGEFITYNKTFIAGRSAYGASPSESSIAVIPNDQMSAG